MKEPNCESEAKWLPSFDSPKLHWKRCCYVVQMWQQTDPNIMDYPDVEQWGWSITDDKLTVKWDSDHNIKYVEKYRKLWSSGCDCRSITKPCNSRTCGCKRDCKPCGPACKCSDLCCNKPIDPSIDALMEGTVTNREGPSVELQVVTHDHLTDEESAMSSDDDDMYCRIYDEIMGISD